MSPTTIILFGGNSSERRVSVASAQNVVCELDDGVPWFLATDGRVHECGRDELLDHKRPFETDFLPRSPALFEGICDALEDAKDAGVISFLALHGGDGENGTLQREHELHAVPFTGSDSCASARAFDKRVAKRVAEEYSIATCPEAEIRGSDSKSAKLELARMFDRFRNLIVKPVSDGSSIGLFHIRAEDEFDNVVQALRGDPEKPYIVEPFIAGRELTVGIYDDGEELRALPPSEVCVVSDHDFDYEGKYLGRGSREVTPAKISKEEMEACQDVALMMHRALGCDGYSRTDVILADEGLFYLETNTLPGLTKASFIPQQLAAARISFKTFLEDQLDLALRKALHR